jgi:hypothetical protein
VRSWNDPARSDSFTSADAVPLLVIFTVPEPVVPSTSDLDNDCGSITSRPAFRVKSARTVPSAATFTVFVAAWYGALVAANGCDPVSEENSQ